MVSSTVMACAMFVLALAAFVVFVEFAHHAIVGRDRDDRLLGSMVALVAFAATLFFAAWGFGFIGL